MQKSNSQRSTSSPKRLKRSKWQPKRVIALALCASMAFSLITFILPTRAVDNTNPAGYIREADKNTMDSYVQASLGGYIYDSTTHATVRNNFGTRYAGEVWADLSVFARGQSSETEIRNNEGEVIGTGKVDFDGETLFLDTYTDGVNSSVDMLPYSDFLNVFSVLGSSQQVVDGGPFDVVMVLDVSGSMGDFTEDTKIYQSVKAMNTAISGLMALHPDNRVGVVVFGSRPYVLMELDHYWPMSMTYAANGRTDVENPTYTSVGKGTNNPETYITVTDVLLMNSYTIEASANTSEDDNNANKIIKTGKGANPGASNEDSGIAGEWDAENNEWNYIGYDTNMDSGLWTGLKMLADSDDLVIDFEEKKVCRTPAFIFLGDGDPQLMMNAGIDDDNDGTVDHEWWNPEDPESEFTLRGNVNSNATTERQGTSTFNNAAIIAGTVMRAALMKAAVNNHYRAAAAGTENVSSVELKFYTIGIDLGQNTGNDPHPFGRAVATAIMDPGNTAKEAGMGFNAGNNGTYSSSDGTKTWISAVGRAYELWNNWRNNNPDVSEQIVYGDGYGGTQTVIFNQFDQDQVVLFGNDGGNGIVVTKQDVINVMMNEDGSVKGYTDAYFDAEGAQDIGSIFDELISMITSPAYRPVAGTNATGVGNSLTYSNPIGDYMTVDDVTDVTMFGKHYKVSRRAVYDYQANYAIRSAKPGGADSNPLIDEGWYSETENGDGSITYKFEGAALSGDMTAEDAWANGWKYRVRYSTASQFVPTWTGDESSLNDKERDTTYTLYTITGEYQKSWNENSKQWEVNKDTTTPVSEDTVLPNLSYADDDGVSRVTFNPLEHIRIWVEDTGEYRDADTGGFVVDSGYSKALYINIGVEALPVQVATVTRNSSGGAIVPDTYSTNLSETEKSTPLRVYYDVSLDPNYLRYATQEDTEKQDKSQAVGVAMADISAPYSKANTSYYFLGEDGHYNEATEDNPAPQDAEQYRYTAFYTNYFTNNTYGGYSTTLADADVSRGNAAVTFAASEDNQFYRFQKNRVLFLIPGTYGLEDRPAEIDLGDLANVWIGDTDGKVYPASGAGRHKCNPADFEDLLAVLNNARETSGEGGAPSPYWWFGDCIAVDGGDNMADPEIMYYQRIQEKNDTGGAAEKRLEEYLANLSKPELSGSNQALTHQPQISPNNWYYIVREFYYPTAFPDGQAGSTDQVELRYMAIARKGSEFGSGVAGGGIENMGAMIEWYHPGDGDTEGFDGANTNGHWGYPAEQGGIEEIPGGGHKHTGGWYVSAKPGGLRVGGMSNFVGTKGYDIRAGVSQTDFTKETDVIAKANITERAQTYFLPAVSSFDVDTSDNNKITNVSIVVYLGNNGRILVDQTLLLVTKLVVDEDNTPVLNDQTPFTFEVSIQGFTGMRSAVKVMWDETAGKWRRTIGSINAVTNPAGLLYGAEYSDQLATVNTNGEFDEDGGYYVYIPGADESISRTVYSYDNSSMGTRNEKTANKIEFLVNVVYLIPKDSYNNAINSGNGWTFSGGDGYTPITADAEAGTGFVIATMNPNVSEDNADIILSSGYSIDAEYLSQPGIDFGSYGTATVTLKSGEGLLFNTIANDAKFTVDETLTDGQVNAGYNFKSANGEESPTNNGKYGFKYTFNDAIRTYTVEGTTGNDEAVAHYINARKLTGMTIRKDLTAQEGTTIGDLDLEKEFRFTVSFTGPAGDPPPALTGPFTYEISASGTVIRSGSLLPAETPEAEAGRNDIVADRYHVWPITLKAGEKFYVEGLPEDSGYSYTVTEEPSTGYVPQDGEYTKRGIVNPDSGVLVAFNNIKQAPDPIQISLTAAKEVTGDGAPELEAGQYSFTIIPMEGNPEDDPIKGKKTAWNEAPDAIDPNSALAKLIEGAEYKKAGTYTYYVYENNPGADAQPGISYDGTIHTVTVTIREKYVGNAYTKQLEAFVNVDGRQVTGIGNVFPTADFVNSYDEDEITITFSGIKTFRNGKLVDGEFTFELKGITFDGELPPMPDDAADGVLRVTNEGGVFSFGEITFHEAGIYTYEIREIPGNRSGVNYDERIYTVTVTVEDVNGVLRAAWIFAPRTNDQDLIEFVNISEVGDLTVTKTVTGNAGDRNKVFNFVVTLSDRTITGTYGVMALTNGVAEFALKHGESMTATGLPAGITYTVTEAEADQDGYTTTVTGATGTIPANGTAIAAFINDKTLPPEETPPPSESLPPEETPPPSESLPPDIPQTGDESQFGLWLTLLGLSVAGLFVSLFYTVRKFKPKDKDQK